MAGGAQNAAVVERPAAAAMGYRRCRPIMVQRHGPWISKHGMFTRHVSKHGEFGPWRSIRYEILFNPNLFSGLSGARCNAGSSVRHSHPCDTRPERRFLTWATPARPVWTIAPVTPGTQSFACTLWQVAAADTAVDPAARVLPRRAWCSLCLKGFIPFSDLAIDRSL